MQRKGGRGTLQAGNALCVWKYGDKGDIAPWAVLTATPITKLPGRRLVLNPEA